MRIARFNLRTARGTIGCTAACVLSIVAVLVPLRSRGQPPVDPKATRTPGRADRLPGSGGVSRRLVPICDRLARQARPARGHGGWRRHPRRRRRRLAGPLFLQRRADRRPGGQAGPALPHPGGFRRNKGDWRFEDITERAGAPGPSYAMGAAVGDYDGDGRDDLLVTGWRDQRLYRNLGGGRFEDATRRRAVLPNAWSTAACRRSRRRRVCVSRRPRTSTSRPMSRL